MCGICGFVGKGTLSDLKAMNEVMAHRGPDSDGYWNDGKVFLGHRRLSIIDLSGGSQPMESIDKNYVIVFNGEIYNFKELKRELILEGVEFKTDHSDTEVLLNSYIQWGERFVEKLNGMWAFAIYDKIKGKMFVSRDRFGQKPLYYSVQNGVFAFASELSSLIKHPYINDNLSMLSIQKYFAYGFIPAPNSLYKNIFKLDAGHNITLDIKTLNFKVKEFWDYKIDPFTNVDTNSEAKWIEEIQFLLEKSVERRMISDVPLGIFLSGGVDSSIITYLAAKVAGERNVKTFSISFDDSSFDESIYANQIATLFNTEHKVEKLNVVDARNIIPSLLDKLDEPVIDRALLPNYLLSEVTRKHVTVALGGDGADELFAGYEPFGVLKYTNLYNNLVPKGMNNFFKFLVMLFPTSLNKASFSFKLKRMLKGLSFDKRIQFPTWLGALSFDEISEAFDEKFEIEDIYSEALRYWDKTREHNIYDKLTYFYIKMYMQDGILSKVDRTSMMNSLEVRAPFLDIDFVDLIRKIPHNYKIRNGEKKYILKKAFSDFLPKEVLYRKKAGFDLPIGKWIRDKELDVNTDTVNVKKSFAEKQYFDHIHSNADNKSFLWGLAMSSRLIN